MYSKAGESISEALPKSVKSLAGETAKSMANVGKLFLETPTGHMATSALQHSDEAFKLFEETYPVAAANTKAMGQIGLTLALGARPSYKLGRKVFSYDNLDDFVIPMRIKDIPKGAIVSEGARGKPVLRLTPQMKEMKDALKTVHGMNQKVGLTATRGIEYIDSELGRAFNKTVNRLSQRGTVVSKQAINRKLGKAMNKINSHLDKTDRMTPKQRSEYYQNVWDKIGKPKSTLELYKARLNVDKRFREFAQQRRLDPNGGLIPTRKEIEWRETRNVLNELLEELEPGYKKEMRRQHMLMKSLDILEDKSRNEYLLSQMSFIERHAPKIRGVFTPSMTKSR
jgi:hypothetical protein